MIMIQYFFFSVRISLKMLTKNPAMENNNKPIVSAEHKKRMNSCVESRKF